MRRRSLWRQGTAKHDTGEVVAAAGFRWSVRRRCGIVGTAMRTAQAGRQLRRSTRRKKRKSRRAIRASMAFNRFLRMTYGRFLKWRYRVVLENQQLIENLKPP